MALPAKQNPLDWITQCWNIALGTRLEAVGDQWLLGPVGRIGESMDQFLARVAKREGLRVMRSEPGAGLVESLDDWPAVIHPQIGRFYRHTADFEFQVQSVWKAVFGSLGYLVARLFSRRVRQLNLPRDAGGHGITLCGDVIKLVDANARTVYTIWHRYVKTTGEVVFWGIYGTCRIPAGDLCVKVVFPLPQGSATVVFRIGNDAEGNLFLSSSGVKDGDPGFYFVVIDRKGNAWKHYLPGMRETIWVGVCADRALRARHDLRLWRLPVYRMTYQIHPRSNSEKG